MSASQPVTGPQVVVERVHAMAYGGAVVTIVTLGLSIILLALAGSEMRADLLYSGLAVAGISTTSAAITASLHSHRMSLRQQIRTQQMLCKHVRRVEEQLRDVARIEGLILATTDQDELARRRRNSRHS